MKLREAFGRWLIPPVETTDRFIAPGEEIAEEFGDISMEGALDLARVAEGVASEPHERADIAERRATALLAAVGVASGVFAAAMGLLFDKTKIENGALRWAAAAGFGAVLYCLFMCALRALLTLRNLNWQRPAYEDLVPSSETDELTAVKLRAATLFHVSARNEGNARWKIAQASAASFWMVWSVGLLVLTAAFLMLVAVSHPNRPAPSRSAIVRSTSQPKVSSPATPHMRSTPPKKGP